MRDMVTGFTLLCLGFLGLSTVISHKISSGAKSMEPRIHFHLCGTKECTSSLGFDSGLN